MKKLSSGAALVLAALAAPAAALGQAPERRATDCVVTLDANGVIRGDRVPTGCVITSGPVPAAPAPAPAPEPEPAGGIFVGTSVVFVPVVVGSRVFLPDPPFIGVPPGPGAAAGAEGFPQVESGAFGPILRPFGPTTQPFRPTNQEFGRSPAPAAPTPSPPAP